MRLVKFVDILSQHYFINPGIFRGVQLRIAYWYKLSQLPKYVHTRAQQDQGVILPCQHLVMDKLFSKCRRWEFVTKMILKVRKTIA